MVGCGLSRLNVKKVIATCDTDNFASKRVLKKIGFHITNTTEDKHYWSY